MSETPERDEGVTFKMPFTLIWAMESEIFFSAFSEEELTNE